MTRPWFDRQMARLIGLRFMPASMGTHWDALHDLPEAVLEAAITRAQRTRSEFPSPVELRQDADQVRAHVRPPTPARRGAALEAPVVIGTLPAGRAIHATCEWRYYCDTCGDSGWEELWCGPHQQSSWMRAGHCGRRRCESETTLGHSWVQTCACAASNPAVQRRKDRDAKYAAPAATERRRGAA